MGSERCQPDGAREAFVLLRVIVLQADLQLHGLQKPERSNGVTEPSWPRTPPAPARGAPLTSGACAGSRAGPRAPPRTGCRGRLCCCKGEARASGAGPPPSQAPLAPGAPGTASGHRSPEPGGKKTHRDRPSARSALLASKPPAGHLEAPMDADISLKPIYLMAPHATATGKETNSLAHAQK